jgi:hypothetical protein
MLKKILLLSVLALTSSVTLPSSATYEQELADFSRDFQTASYATEAGEARTKALDGLLARAVDLKSRYPNRGMPLAWVGWLKFNSMYSQTDPATMMPLLLDARANLEKAIEIEPNCCGPEAFVTLAIIYQVPLTGKDQRDTVRMYFAKAFAIDPNGVIPNTRFAGFLMRNGELEAALKHANAALAAPPLRNRPGEDRAVREQAQDFIEQITDRMKRTNEASATK